MIDLLGSIFSGGALGFLGGIATQVIGLFQMGQMRKNKKLDYAHDEKKWDYEAKLINLQMEAAQQESENQLELATVLGSYSGLETSIKDQTTITRRAAVWVVNILAFVRPVLTVVLLGYMGYLAIWADLVFAQKEAVFLASAAVMWWFGDRSALRAAKRYSTEEPQK